MHPCVELFKAALSKVRFGVRIKSLYEYEILYKKQEAQLSQRDRAMLRVIEYFAKSLKIIRNDILRTA